MNCRLVLSSRSQFFHNRLFFSSQAKLRSTTQRLEHDLEGAQLTPSGDLHRHMSAQKLLYALRKGLAHVAAIA